MNYEYLIKQVELFNAWADFEGLDIKMSSETEHSSKDTHLAFLAWRAAKAQAVPEGYVVVPVELLNFQANSLAEEEFQQNKVLFESENRGLSATELELKKHKWCQWKAEGIKQTYRRLVKWASESGAEG